MEAERSMDLGVHISKLIGTGVGQSYRRSLALTLSIPSMVDRLNDDALAYADKEGRSVR